MFYSIIETSHPNTFIERNENRQFQILKFDRAPRRLAAHEIKNFDSFVPMVASWQNGDLSFPRGGLDSYLTAKVQNSRSHGEAADFAYEDICSKGRFLVFSDSVIVERNGSKDTSLMISHADFIEILQSSGVVSKNFTL